MSSTRKELLDKIIQVYPDLSPKKRRVADFIIKDHKSVFFMTAREIARACDVSEPTIIRFAVDLGFSGYQEFVQHMKGLLHMELTGVERLMKASRDENEASTLQRYCRNAVDNLETLSKSVSDEDLKRVAGILYRAPDVYVAGYRASGCLAQYFGYLLMKIRSQVFLDTDLSWDLLDRLAKDGGEGVLFVIAFPRYPRRTLQAARFARQNGVMVIGLSDTPGSPLFKYCDECVLIDMEGISFIDPFAHVLAYLSALIHEITFWDEDRAMEHLSAFDAGVSMADEFFSEQSSSPQQEEQGEESYSVALWPQGERG